MKFFKKWLLSVVLPAAEFSTSEASASWLKGEAMLCQHCPSPPFLQQTLIQKLSSSHGQLSCDSELSLIPHFRSLTT